MSTPPTFQTPYPRPHLGPIGKPCPRCGNGALKKIRYTWWGGVFAPRLMKLTKCMACGYLFNGETGKPAKNAIIVYNVVINAFGLLIVAPIILMRSR